MGQMDGKNVFLTGASKGIGREIARGLAKEGASIAFVARTESALREVAEEVSGLGGRGVAIPADVSDRDAGQGGGPPRTGELGDIHVLVNSAGVLDNEPIAGHSDDAWEHHYGVNVNSYFYTIREIIGEMFERGEWAGDQHRLHFEQGTHRSEPSSVRVLQACCFGLTKEVAFEAAPHGVTVNAICPGFVLTDMVEDSMRKFARDAGKTPEETRAFWVAKIPLGRFIDPQEVVPLLLFLVSDGAGAITMQAINVDGGFSPI